jgi:hypothetical protein
VTARRSRAELAEVVTGSAVAHPQNGAHHEHHHLSLLGGRGVTVDIGSSPRMFRCPRLISQVPAWYRPSVAMNLRLTDTESAALRGKAAEEGRSMQEVARSAIAQYVSNRPERLRAAIERVRTEDAELLDRLSR